MELPQAAHPAADFLAATKLRIAPVPDWAVHEPYYTGETVDDAYIVNGLCLLLRDSQVDLSGSAEAHHVRVAHRVLTSDGASQIAQFSATFDPALQELAVHFINVIRGGRVIQHANIEAFELMRREKSLERRVFDGRRTAALIVPDVQPGDIVEQCWTIYSDNPVLRGFFAEWQQVDGFPALALRYRLRAPKDRRIAERNFNTNAAPENHDTDTLTDRRWLIEKPNRVEGEALAPSWQLQLGMIQLAEERSWSEISRNFAPYYRPDAAPDALTEEAARIEAYYPADPAGRVLAALTFVQSRLRYLSLSLGEGGIVPRPTEQVLSSGYGDCKDSARLFASLLHLCGIDAVPALVSTRFGPGIDAWLPSAASFDHCITRVRVGDKTYWIDPTRQSRAPTLDDYVNAQMGWALPLSDPGSELEAMPDPEARLSLEVSERIVFAKKLGQPAQLQLRVDYCGLYADWVAAQLHNQGLKTLSDHFRKRYENTWPGIAYSEPLKADERRDAYRITLTATFGIDKPWKPTQDGRISCSLVDHDLAGDLNELARPDNREHAIVLGRPRILKRRVEAFHPLGWGTANVHYKKAARGLSYNKEIFAPRKDLIQQDQTLTVSGRLAPAAEAKTYAELVRYLNSNNVLVLRRESSGQRIGVAAGPSWWTIMWVAWIVIVVFSAIIRSASVDNSAQPASATLPATQSEHGSEPGSSMQPYFNGTQQQQGEQPSGSQPSGDKPH